MAKSVKVEDYWRENNLENLLKDITQLLARRMPSDPAIAIVEHLQKKFPKSFKARVQSITSVHSEHQNESLNETLTDRRLSNQSQISGIVTIPSTGSAFTNLLKQNNTSATIAPEISLKNLVFANRLSQHAVKLAKDIRSDRDILEEESIKPSKHKPTTVHPTSEDSTIEGGQTAETDEESSIPQLIKYKQQIHLEHDRRIHRENLANLAKSVREKESFVQSDLSAKPEEIQRQNLEDDETSTHVVPTENQTHENASHKHAVGSKAEEDILDDENIFGPRRQRDRGRNRKKFSPSRQVVPILGRLASNLTCQVCGNRVDGNDNPSMPQPSAESGQRPSQSVETIGSGIDDWFESSSSDSGPQQPISSTPNDLEPSSTGSTTFRQNLFQPIDDVVELIPPVDPKMKTQRLTTPRLSESGIFTRSPDTKIVRPPSTRSSPSPTAKKHQTKPTTKSTSNVRENSFDD